jgi:hypothetical protein
VETGFPGGEGGPAAERRSHGEPVVPQHPRVAEGPPPGEPRALRRHAAALQGARQFLYVTLLHTNSPSRISHYGPNS